jgi:YbgC/YbaW family acyl-CoA thioester hydrolase
MIRATIELLYGRVPLFHHIDLRVMWADTDPAGIVWFGVFCRYFENAEEDLFRRLGQDRTKLLRQLNIFMPRTSFESRFRSPAKLGDEIAVGIGVRSMTDRRIEYAFDIHERGTDRLICESSYRVACVDASSFAPRAFPPEIVALLTVAVVGGPEKPAPQIVERSAPQ